jgi:hypothetical protein
VGQRCGLAIRPERAQVVTQLYGGRRPLRHPFDTGLQHRVDVDPFEPVPAVRHVLEHLALESRLDQRTVREEVPARHQVDRCPHHRTAHGLAVLDQPGEFSRIEVVEAGPQSYVRRERRLGLHTDQVLDRLQRGRVPAFGQPLAMQGGAIQGLQTQLRHG